MLWSIITQFYTLYAVFLIAQSSIYPCTQKRSAILYTSDSAHLGILAQSKVFGGRDDTESVRVAHTTSPALNTNDSIALSENTKLDGIHDTPLETTIDVLLPRGLVEIRLGLWEVERIHASVQV